MSGSHSLQRLLNEVARDVSDPVKGTSVAERLRGKALLGSDESERRRALDREELRLDALGSGSDYTPFLQHLGIASLNVGFGGEGDYGQYHSIYDSFDHYVRFMDPDFAYGVALAKVGGRTVLRLSQAELLPFEFTAVSAAVTSYVEELEALTGRLRGETEHHNQALERGAFEAVAPPDETRVTPARKDPVPYLNFAPLRNAAERLQQAARAYDRVLADKGPAAPADARSAANAILLSAERAFTRPGGPLGPALVPPPRLRARLLHRLRRQDAAARARGDRGPALGGCREGHRRHGRGAHGVRGRDRARGEGARRLVTSAPVRSPVAWARRPA